MEIRNVLNINNKAQCPYCSSTLFYFHSRVVHPKPAGRFLWWKWDAFEGYLELQCYLCDEYCKTKLGENITWNPKCR